MVSSPPVALGAEIILTFGTICRRVGIRKLHGRSQTHVQTQKPFRFGVLFFLLGCTFGAPDGRAQDWPRVISKLERAGARQRKAELPTAYNNYAIQLSNKGEFEEAEKQLEKAVALALDHKNKTFKKNLSTIYLNHAFEVRQDRRNSGYQMQHLARKLAERALRHDRNLAEAHVLIGDVAYDSQDLHLAKLSWTRAKSMAPSLAGVEDRLAKLAREYSVERNFDRAGNAYFDLRYQDGINPSTAVGLANALREARDEVGRDFKHWPRHKLVVLVYTDEAFARVRQGPDWVAGVYDGKIRIPLPRTRSAAAVLKPTLYHEYTHAIIHDLTRNQCPVWLNEGLAEFQESKVRAPSLNLLRTTTRVDRLIPFASLDAAFKSSDIQVAGLAYQESYSMVKYLVDRFGFVRLSRTLKRLAQGTTWEEAVREEYRLKVSVLEHRWKKWLPDLVR
jgi:hypothetical protein